MCALYEFVNILQADGGFGGPGVAPRSLVQVLPCFPLFSTLKRATYMFCLVRESSSAVGQTTMEKVEPT